MLLFDTNNSLTMIGRVNKIASTLNKENKNISVAGNTMKFFSVVHLNNSFIRKKFYLMNMKDAKPILTIMSDRKFVIEIKISILEF